jgi:transcription termination factor Rho
MEKEKVNLSELKATSAADLLKVAETLEIENASTMCVKVK